MSGECTCCPPGKRPAIEHARGCPRRAPRTVPLTTLSVGDQLSSAADVTREPTGGQELREALAREVYDRDRLSAPETRSERPTHLSTPATSERRSAGGTAVARGNHGETRGVQ